MMMRDGFENKRFSQIGILSYLKGRDAGMIVEKFKEEAGRLDNQRRHQIRQRILSTSNLSSTLSLTGDLKIVLDHIPYTYEDELSAVCLETCQNYHQFHIRYVAEKISREGKFSCHECKVECQSTSEITLNAFVASYFDKIKNYEGSTLIFKKEQIGSMFMAEREKEAMQTQEKSVVPSRDRQGEFNVIQLKILQIDNKDERIKEINTEKIAEEIEKVSMEDKSKNYEERQLQNSTNHFFINLICFKSLVRIRNPLIHRLCRPQDHKNRLILYSYEQIYSMTFKAKKKKSVKCIFPQCPNYFDEKNFQDVAVVVDSIHKLIYEEYKECVYGEYFSGMYQKNWHYNYAENMLLKNQKNRPLIKRYLGEIRTLVQQLLSTAGLTQKKAIYKDLKKCLEESHAFDKSIILLQHDKENKIIVVDLAEANLCPVRCTSCKNLNSLDAYKVAYQYMRNPEKICPICNKDVKKKTFYDMFYIDLQLMEFLFLDGHNKEVYYDIKSKSYFHKLSFFTGRSLKQKLKQENKVKSGYLYQGAMDVKLPRDGKFVPLIDKRCSEKALPHEYNKHIIYINENDKLKEETYCPACNRLLRSDCLEFNEQLETILKAENNELRWGASNQKVKLNYNARIVSIKYYKDIKNEFIINQDKKIVKFYWKNYEGTLIRYPFKFKGCDHPLQTAICDFTDILYQSKVEKLTEFQCRYKDCEKKYSFAEEIEKVSLDIYSKIEQNPQTLRKIINNNEYWIEFNIEDLTILKTSKNFSDSIDDKNEQQLIEKYRNKFVDSTQEANTRKEINQNIRKVTEEIEYIEQKIKEDQLEEQKNGSYKHSQNKQQFDKLLQSLDKLNSKKSKLAEQRKLLMNKEMEENRRQNKASTINFMKLIKMYQPEVNKLKERKDEEDPFENAETDNFSCFRHYGNLFPFKYAVKKTTPSISLKDVEQILINGQKK